MINDIPTASEARRPRAVLMVGDKQIKWTAFEMQHNGIYEAATLRVTMPVEFKDWAFWSQQTEIIVDVYVGFLSGPDENLTTADLPLLMTARIDEFRLDPVTSTVTLAGRDLTSLFIDHKVSANYQNLTSSQIMSVLVEKFPILNQNITKTTTLVGNYYTGDFTLMAAHTSMWKLMTFLAQQEGFQCLILGRDIYFGKFGSELSDGPYGIVYQKPSDERASPVINVERIVFGHDLTISNEVTVTVSSHHGMHGASYHATAHNNRKSVTVQKSAKLVGLPTHYSYTFPGLTEADCKKKAYQFLASISLHEYRVEATMPGDTVTFPWTPLQVTGTGTPFDTTYQIARITRTFDTRGYLQTVDARTVPPGTTIELT